jgi:hypothetical protein
MSPRFHPSAAPWPPLPGEAAFEALRARAPERARHAHRLQVQASWDEVRHWLAPRRESLLPSAGAAGHGTSTATGTASAAASARGQVAL